MERKEVEEVRRMELVEKVGTEVIRKIKSDVVEEVKSEEMLEEIRNMFFKTGGFELEINSEQLKDIEYIYLVSGNRPGPSFSYTLRSVGFTDGEVELVSIKTVYNYPTQDDTTYKYKVKNAKWVVIAEKYGDDFDGDWVWKETKVTVYGSCPFHEKIKELQEELKI